VSSLFLQTLQVLPFFASEGSLKNAQCGLILAATNSALYAQTRMIFALITPAKEAQSTGTDVVTRQQRYVVMLFAETFFSVATYHVVFAPQMVAFAPSNTVVVMLPSLDLVVKLLSGSF
jgi:hypothetical protein